MRDIKFRVYDPEYKLVVGYEMVIDGRWWSSPVGKPTEYILGITQGLRRTFDRYQYTGLKDKNGVEIYEGDILKVKILGYPHMNRKTAIVSYVYGGVSAFRLDWVRNIKGKEIITNCWEFSDTDLIFMFPKSEVVGNIYENSELLKEAK